MLLLALYLAQCSSVQALTFGLTGARPSLHRPKTISSLQMMSGPNEEIAELEARLAELKAAEAAAPQPEAEEAAEPLANAASQPKGFDSTTLSFRSKVANVKGPAPSELLSESWKEQDEPSEGGGSLVTVLGGLVTLVALIAFSQVPIGTEVETFNDGRSANVESPADIRARYANAGYGEE